MDLKTLLNCAKDAGASDLHLSAGLPPMMRLDGNLWKLSPLQGVPWTALPESELRQIIYQELTADQRERLDRDRELDFAISLDDGTRFRTNIFFQERGLAAAFRLIPTKIRTLDELAMPETVKKLSEMDRGLVLVTGATGSGKSTTLAAMVEHINSTRAAHIITIEDPIEFIHIPKRSIINQREVGQHTRSFANALRAALREDPDVILVGEMRDLETISLAITAAETGHLVLATLHTHSAHTSVDRMINVFPAHEQAQIRSMLSESLQGVLSQVLVPKKGGRGRVLAMELMVAIPGIRALIREQKTHQIPLIIQTGAQYGMITIEHSLNSLVKDGLVAREIADGVLASLGLIKDVEKGSAEEQLAAAKSLTQRMVPVSPPTFRPR